MLDPYAVLGIARGAGQDEIVRAFRRRSKQTHPDVARHVGAAAEFDRVKRAYEVLSDPAKRARYDATGEIEDEKPGTGDEAALGFISGMVASLLGGEADPFQVDLIHAMGEAIKSEIGGLEKKRRVMERASKRAERMAGRFSLRPADGNGPGAAAQDRAVGERRNGQARENVLDRMIAHHKAQIERELKKIEKNLATARRAREILQEYAFKADEVPDLYAFGNLGSAASTSSTAAGFGGFAWKTYR